MILLLIPVVGVALGIGLWIALRAWGSLNVLGAEPTRQPRGERVRVVRSGDYGWRDRIDDLPQGCLFGVIAAAALWVLGWLILLIVGLSVLS